MFGHCSSLTSVTIPDSVKEIANDAFFGCENLSIIYGDPFSTAQTYAEKNNITFVTTMPRGTCGENLTWTLSNDGTLVISGTGNMTMIRVFYDTPWYRYRENIKKVIIEDGVTSVGNDAFYECTNLASVNIPDSITIIGSGAFSDCTSLTSVNIPDSVTIIEDYAFQHTSLTSVTIPRSVEEIGRDAFWISTLTSITIKNPRCEIYAGGITISDGVIYGYPDSTAKSYASNYRMEFIALDGEPEETTTTATSTAKQETTTMTIITETTPAYSESIVLSIRPEKTSYTVAANNNVIYLQKESLPDTLHLGVYIDKYDSSCSNLNLKLCSDTDKITFIKDTFCNPSSYRYDVAKIYTLSNGTIFSTRFQPYALGRINSAGNYEPGCVFDKADFDSTGKEMTFCWTYDYSDYDASGNKLMNAPLLTDIPDELSFIEFDVKLDQTIAPGSYQLYFYTDETYNDSTYVTLDESVPDEEIPGLYKSIYKRFPPAVRNLSIVVLPEETAPETTSVTTTFTTTTTTTATTTAITTSASATTASTTSESVATTNETTTETKLSLLLKESKVILKAGQQYQIEANQDNLTYSSSNPEIAVVSSSGMVTALKKGEAVISVINQEYDVTQITLTVTSDTSESQAELGDLTQDEKVDASDAAMILVAAANQGSGQDSGLTEIQKTAADVNHDGKIDASDAAYILQYAAAKGAGAFAGTLSEYMSSIL